MRRTVWLLIFLVALTGLSATPGLAQSGSAASVQISGVVQSFSGNTLDVKPAASPAVWVMIPADLHADRNALKPGAEVTVEAHWDGLVYVATQAALKK